MSKPLTYHVYSEFKNSNWYAYWDREFAKTKQHQLMLVWHINEADHVPYDYVTLKALLKERKAETGLPYMQKLSQYDIKEFIQICEEFCTDVDLEFDTKD